MPTHHQPSGPGATGGLPGANADPDVVQFTPEEAASTVAMGSVAPVGETGAPTGTLRQTEEDPPVGDLVGDRGDDDALDALQGTAGLGESEDLDDPLPGDLPGDDGGTASYDAEELPHLDEGQDEGLRSAEPR